MVFVDQHGLGDLELFLLAIKHKVDFDWAITCHDVLIWSQSFRLPISTSLV